MLSSKELVKNLKSNTPELPDEYIKRAGELADKYNELEKEYRKQLGVVNGRDDRMSPILKKLTLQLREDIAKLRKEFNLD